MNYRDSYHVRFSLKPFSMIRISENLVLYFVCFPIFMGFEVKILLVIFKDFCGIFYGETSQPIFSPKTLTFSIEIK